MLLRIEDHDAPPVSAAEFALSPGFLGRIGGPLHDGGHRTIELWHVTAPEAAARGESQTWHCLQDIEGIYDAIPRALLSANHLRIEEFQVEPDGRERWVEHQRKLRNPRLARASGFLAGGFATQPQHPGRFLEVSLWQTREDHDNFVGASDDDPVPGPREVDILALSALRSVSLESEEI